jgi:hypothetical protein
LYPTTITTALLLVVPSTYGRWAAGVSVATRIQDAETAMVTMPATVNCRSRSRTAAWATSRYTAAKAGSTAHACSILAWNPRPTHTPAHTSGRSRALPAASCHASAARIRHMVNAESSISECPNIATAIGVTAKTAAASSPATGPAQRRTTR